MEDRWLPHFEEIEAGQRIDLHALFEACHVRQQEWMQHPAAISLEDLPTLQQFETALRKVRPGKATGIDPFGADFYHQHSVEVAKLFYPLILKIFQFQTEPANWKGGIMAVLPKVGDPQKVNHFRGIMLLNTVAKSVHTLLRARLLPVLQHDAPRGQIGGFPHQEVMFGSQFVRMFGQVASSHHLSAGVLFIDLQQAFHRLIREAVVGFDTDQGINTVLHALEQEQHPTARVQEFLKLPCILERLQAPAYLVRLLRDVHLGTRFTLDRKRFTQTHRGTRPGSPLADIIFHAIIRDVANEVQAWLDQHTELQQLLQRIDVELSPVIWADDIAIPVCATKPEDLIPLLSALVVQVFHIFQDKGFKLNLARGKTAAVITFRGPKAPQLRKDYLLVPNPGVECTTHSGQKIWLHFEHVYRHLGTQYASDQTLATELFWRTGQACSAFQQLARPLLTNKHLPEYLRLWLFKALVSTRLFFGAGAWRTPTLRQMHKLRSAWIRLLRRTMRLNPADTHKSNLEVCLQAGEADLRAKLAYERLLYAQRFFAHAPSHIHHLAHVEYSCTPTSWLHGLQADLVWLHALVPDRVPQAWTVDFTEPIDYWQAGGAQWKSILKDAWKKHRHQEQIILEAKHFHQQIYTIWTKAGATFAPSPFEDSSRILAHTCSCGRSFTTAQGLATHRWQVHQYFSPEYQFLTEATCAHCLKFLWTTQRLRQHLAYMPRDGRPNECYTALSQRFDALPYGQVSFPRAVLGLDRKESLQAEGPLQLGPTKHEIQVAAWTEGLQRCREDLTIRHEPVNASKNEEQLRFLFTGLTKQWCHKWEATCCHTELGDKWLAAMSQLPEEFHPWAEKIFISWGNNDLQDFIAQLVHGELESVLDDAFASVAYDLPRHDCMRRANWYAGRLEFASDPPPVRPHRPVQRGTANPIERATTAQHVTRLYGEQEEWLSKLRDCKLDFHPPDAPTPLWTTPTPMPTFLIAHLFSGRRRQTDCHAQLNKYAERLRVRFVVLSLDTANSIFYGNLEHTSASWLQLQKLYEQGHIAASICGSPCETFTEARYMQPPPEVATPFRWPRPLRSWARLFGLDNLTHREMRQLRAGSAFFLQVIQVLSWHITKGGLFVAEHPAAPRDRSRPSIWTSPLVETFLAVPSL